MKADPLLDAAPGPSPWYLGGRLGPVLPSGYSWAPAPKDQTTAGVTLLKNLTDVVMLVDLYNYVAALDSDALLIWHQQHSQNPSAPVVLRAYRYSDLSALNTPVEELCALMRARRLPVLTDCPPMFECAWPTIMVDEPIEVQIPEQLKHRDEVLILCYSSAIQPGPEAGHGNLPLMVVTPAHGHIKLYPQDWFNNGQVDLGYQWVTRVARDPRTQGVRGDGIRISPFLLDETLRNRVRP